MKAGPESLQVFTDFERVLGKSVLYTPVICALCCMRTLLYAYTYIL